jgi:V/A-type H+/Na+-transporting ATPase subunit C
LKRGAENSNKLLSKRCLGKSEKSTKELFFRMVYMALSFAYTTTRVKGLKSKLLNDTKIKQLIEVTSIPEMIGLLEETDYKEEFVAQSTKFKNMELVMAALHENFINSLEKLVAINPQAGKQALRVLLQEYEIQNINTIIAAKAIGLEITDNDLIIIDKPAGKLVEKLKTASTVEDVLTKLKGTEYSKTIRKSMKEYENTKDFRVVTRSLTAYYFEKLKTLNTKKNALLWKLIDWRNSIKNIMIILRIKRSAPNADALSFLVTRDRFAAELNKITDYNKVLERVGQKYPPVMPSVQDAIKTNSLISLEISLERLFIRKTLRLLKIAVLDFAVVLGYLYLKEEEVGTIRKIAYAKQYGFTDELKGMIFNINA